MKSYKHIISIKNYIFAKFDYNILKNNKNQPIVYKAAIRYMGSIRLFLTYLQYAACIPSFINVALKLRQIWLDRLAWLWIYVYTL